MLYYHTDTLLSAYDDISPGRKYARIAAAMPLASTLLTATWQNIKSALNRDNKSMRLTVSIHS